MFSIFKSHPFSVEAFFEKSVVLTFAIPKEEIEGLIPSCLALDTFDSKWGFIAVAMVQSKSLRPKGFPKFLGQDFHLTGYRVFVKYRNKKSKRLRGLYILKSETDKRLMQFFGNTFTHYNYTAVDITNFEKDGLTTVVSKNANFEIQYKETGAINLPSNSPFTDWKTARRYSGPLPFTFTYQQENNTVLIIEGVRSNWKPKSIHVEQYHIQFLEDFNFSKVILASAFKVSQVPYCWKKGITEKIKDEKTI